MTGDDDLRSPLNRRIERPERLDPIARRDITLPPDPPEPPGPPDGPERPRRYRLGIREEGFVERMQQVRGRPEPDVSAIRTLAAGIVPLGQATAAVTAPRRPSRVDWRDHLGRNHVSPVQDQLNCGSCVAFCCVGLLESMVLREHALLTNLSEADLFFCNGGQCEDGWFTDDGINAIRNRGVALEHCSPYPNPAVQQPCRSCGDRAVTAIRASNSQTIFDVSARKEWLADIGPMAAVMDVYEDFFDYNGGIYTQQSNVHEGRHCVLVIGYDDNDGCWICKNSWGAGWGDNGFFRIAYGECGIDSHTQLLFLNFGSPFWGISGTQLPDAYRFRSWKGRFAASNRVSLAHYSPATSDWWMVGTAGGSLSLPGAGNTAGFGRLHDGRPIWVGDLSGDGRDDLVFYYPGDHNWWLGRYVNNQLAWNLLGNTAGFGRLNDGRPIWMGDFSQAGTNDMLFYYPGDHNWWLGRHAGGQLGWRLVGNTRGFGALTAGHRLWTGDINGDGRDDVLFYYPNDHNWWLGTLHQGSDHFYTTSAVERDNAIRQHGYITESIACYVAATSGNGLVPLYRLLNPKNGDHFYTTSAPERDNAIASHGYVSEGVACYVVPAAQTGFVPLYRLLNPGNGDHFYTTSTPERDTAIASHGYVSEGIACYVSLAARAGFIPLYRMLGSSSLRWQLVGNTSGFGRLNDGRPIWLGDFSTDGKADVLFYYPGDHNWWLGRLVNGQLSWSLVGNTAGFGRLNDGRPFWIGDFTGDGRSDVLFYYPGDHNWWLGRYTNGQVSWSHAGNTAGFGRLNDGRPIWTGDFTGDGREDVLFHFGGDGNWWLGQYNGAQITWSLTGNTARSFVLD